MPSDRPVRRADAAAFNGISPEMLTDQIRAEEVPCFGVGATKVKASAVLVALRVDDPALRCPLCDHSPAAPAEQES